MTTRRRVALLLLFVIAVTPIGFVNAGPDEGVFFSGTNAARSAQGLDPLTSSGVLVTQARVHSEEMAASNSIYHSSPDELTGLISGWQRIAENVGRGASASSLFNAFMNSSSHRKNILGDFTHLGVGTAVDGNGIVYVTMIFFKLPVTTTTTTTTTTTVPASTSTSTSTSVPGSTSTTTSTSTSTSVPGSTSTTTSPSTSTSSVPRLGVADAVGCALDGLGTGDVASEGSAEILVATCEEAAEAATAWPIGTSISAAPGDEGVVLSFSFTPVTSTSTSTSVPDSTTSTTEVVPTTEAPQAVAPVAPGAADLVRILAGLTLVAVAGAGLLLALGRRRR